MAKNQGYIKIIKGYTKTLNISERSRGWIFITKDKRAIELIRPKTTITYMDTIQTFTVDKYGRVLTGKEFIAKLPDKFHILFNDGKLEITP